MTSPHEQALAAETPMADHVANFWHLLETETVRILVNIRRESSSMGIYWDSSSFPDDVAKELVAARRPALPSVEGLVAEFETGRFATWLQALNWCARAAEALRSLSAKLAAVERERDEARRQLVAAWNAFGPSKNRSDPPAFDADDLDDLPMWTGGDLAEQIRLIEDDAEAADAKVKALTERLAEMEAER